MSDETEPKRLGGDLLASARGDAPSAASRARIAGALGLGVGAAATAATTTAAAATTTTTTTAAKVAGLGVWTKVVGVAAVTIAVGGGAIAVSRSDPPAPVTAPSAFVATPGYDSARARRDEIPPPEPSVPPVAEMAEPIASAAASALTIVRTAPSSNAADAPSPLAREVRAIDLARNALDSGYPALALKALDNHDREFPNGPMKTEADVLRVDALVANGDTAAAKRLASQLLARDPAGAHARHLRSVVGNSEK